MLREILSINIACQRMRQLRTSTNSMNESYIYEVETTRWIYQLCPETPSHLRYSFSSQIINFHIPFVTSPFNLNISCELVTHQMVDLETFRVARTPYIHFVFRVVMTPYIRSMPSVSDSKFCRKTTLTLYVSHLLDKLSVTLHVFIIYP